MYQIHYPGLVHFKVNYTYQSKCTTIECYCQHSTQHGDTETMVTLVHVYNP